MPLDRPYPYIVTFDLKGPAFTYRALAEELQRSPSWWHYITSTWIVIRYESLFELGPKLRALIGPNDQLLIMPAKGPADGLLPKDAWEWIRKNLPREW